MGSVVQTLLFGQVVSTLAASQYRVGVAFSHGPSSPRTLGPPKGSPDEEVGMEP